MNRPDELRVALASVFAGTRVPHEIIVSDDGNGSAREVAAQFPNVVYLSGPQRGLGANRNACIARATGDGIAFIDDDVKVAPNFIERAEATVHARTVTTGWEQNYSSTPPRKVTPHNASFLGFQRIDPRGDFRAIVINAAVFPRSLFEVALFDDQIRYGYEEIDIARHAVALGWRIAYDDELHVEHFPSLSNRDGYASALNVSRIYITHKAYRYYDKSRLKAFAFNLVAGAHHVLHSVKQGHGARQPMDTIRQARLKQKVFAHARS